MFTGIVEEVGKVQHCQPSGDGFECRVNCHTVLEGTQLGDSIAVNGVCLTVTALYDDGFNTGLAPETLKRTNLGSLQPGSRVNLERSVTPSTRMGGHFVQGHVDTTGTITEFRRDEDALWVTLSAPTDIMRYVVTKGYITLDGTSLTVVDVGDDFFNVTLVAYTQDHITLPSKSVGDRVNIEVDVLGKYVERLITHTATGKASNVTHEFLTENGYE